MSQKRTHKTLSVLKKQQIISAVDKGEKKKDVAKQFNIAPSTLTSILNKRENILQASPISKLMRQKLPEYPEIEKSLLLWFRKCRQSNVPVSGPLLTEKALFFGKKLNINNFKASSGWLDRFKKRNNISFKKICGESAAVDDDVCLEWREKLKELIKDYDAKDIFNTDETGLFYKCLPDKTHCFKNEKCNGGKHSKDRVTLLFAVNMDATDKLKPLLIGKSAKPRCFKNIQSLPMHYRHNKKAWMTTDLFNEWLQMVNKSMQTQRRKILLFLDNCTAHNGSPYLSHIKLIFLRPNTTSKLQPLDQGIIKNFKALYRKELVSNLVDCIDDGKDFKFTLFDAMQTSYKSWQSITKNCIQNCFRACGFDKGLICDSLDDQLINADHLWIRLPTDSQNYVSFEDYANVDNEVAVAGMLDDVEILQEVLIDDSERDNDDSSAEEHLITNKEAKSNIHQLRLFFSNHVVDEKVFESFVILENNRIL